MRNEIWVLKGKQRLNESESYIVEEFDDEAECRKEMERLQREMPGHYFWLEGHYFWLEGHYSGVAVISREGFWVGD
jgi:hypothetical protein